MLVAVIAAPRAAADLDFFFFAAGLLVLVSLPLPVALADVSSTAVDASPSLPAFAAPCEGFRLRPGRRGAPFFVPWAEVVPLASPVFADAAGALAGVHAGARDRSTLGTMLGVVVVVVAGIALWRRRPLREEELMADPIGWERDGWVFVEELAESGLPRKSDRTERAAKPLAGLDWIASTSDQSEH